MKEQVFNPYLPSWEYVPDGEPRVFGDKLYVYGSHDRSDGEDYCLNDYVCWWAPVSDLSDWHFEGTIYKAVQDPRNTDGKMHMCAPDCVQGPDGRYYLYYQLHALQCTCAAVSDQPQGPFEYYGAVQHEDGTPWGEKKGDTFVFDPGVLVDDDQRVYLYCGFSTKGLMQQVFKMRGNKVDGSVCLELDADMITVKGEEHPIVPGSTKARNTEFEGHAFYEASSIRKVNGKYCYVYSSELSHELCYAYSDSPTGGFHYGGTLISIADIGYRGNEKPLNYLGNTHGGMTEINGQWYIFYHRQTNRRKCCRQGCAEKLNILPDGRIEQAQVTSCGLNSGPLKAKGCYGARIACLLNGKDGIISSDGAEKKDKKLLYPYFTQTGEDREADGDQYIANMKDGAWCGFRYFTFEGDETEISICVKSTSYGVVTVHSELDRKPLAEIAVSPSEEWTVHKNTLDVKEGVSALYFVFHGTGVMDFSSFEIR